MDNNELMLVGLLALAAISAGVIVYLLISPYLSGELRADKRIQAASENKGRRIALKQQVEVTNSRRRHVADTLKELENRQKQREKVSMRLRLQRAGLDIAPRVFWIASVICGVIVGGAIWVMAPNLPIIVPLLGSFVGALGMPRWILARMTKRRQYKFTDEFANAIDVIVRGVKSGLPLIECLNIIARESPQPISGEFTELDRTPARGRTACRRVRSHDDTHAAARGALLRDRPRHSAAGRRQSFRGAGQPVGRVARSQASCRQRCERSQPKPRPRLRCWAHCRSSS